MPQYTPICLTCMHYKEGLTCDAFLKRIPDLIIEGRHNHKTNVKGDHGILYEPNKKMIEEIKKELKK